MLDSFAATGPALQPESPDARDLRVAICSDAAPDRNGVGTYYQDLAEHLEAAGAEVELVTPRFRDGEWSGGLRLPLPGDPTQRFLIPSPLAVSRRVFALRPNTVVVPTPGPYGLLGMHLAGRTGARLVVAFHTHFERLTGLFPGWRLRGRIAQSYLTACHRLLFRRSALVLANSQEMIRVAQDIGARRVRLMGTPIAKRFLDGEPPPLPRTLKRVLFAGRLAPEKGLEQVTEAARCLPELEILVAGDGPLKPWLEVQSRALPNLTQLGWVSRARVLTLIDSVDCLVLPSRVESFGTIALEAMARARTVLVSSACGILSWERLAQGLFAIRADESLANALSRVRDLDPALRARKARIGREAALEINGRSLDHWLAVLRGDAPGCSMTGLDEIRTLVSVHDVMPETLDQVQTALDLIAETGAGAVTLLVVPGRDWDRPGIERLRAWQDRGFELAGHGWTHRVERFGGLAHRLHGLLISRRTAEHLSMDRNAIAWLLARCHAWFPEQGLRPPSLYVPPAWALGDFPRAALAALPFAHYEVLTGLIPSNGRAFTPLPLLGYEADTAPRALALRLSNRLNRRLAQVRGCVRIAIHPHDLGLRLADDLRRDLADYRHRIDYTSL